MDSVQIDQVAALLTENKLGVISTNSADDESPESALVAFVEDQDLNIYFQTKITTRKYENLQNNPRVSFVIGWGDNLKNLQYEGVARQIDTTEAAVNLFLEKNRLRLGKS